MIAVSVLLLALTGQAGPAWHEPHLLAAKNYLARGDSDRAAEALEILLSAEAGLPPEVHLTLMDAWLKLDRADKAADAGERAIKAHPKSGPLLKRTGHILFRRSYTNPRAGELLENASRILPQDPEAAIEAERRALALSAGNDAARMQICTVLAIAHDKLGHAKQAEQAFAEALDANRRLRSFDPNAALEYVQFLVRQSREQEAQRIVGEMLHHAPQFGPARLERAKYLSAQGENEKAISEALSALDLAGDDPLQQRAAHAFLARTYFALGQEEEAQKHQRWIEEHQK